MDYIDSVLIHNTPHEYLNGRNKVHYEVFERLIDAGKINAYEGSLDAYKDMKLFYGYHKL